MEQITSPKRTRASGKKVRTGCSTCKTRRVKCDEQKPECIRCINMGVKCGGYQHLESIARAGTSRSDAAESPARNHRSLAIIQLIQVMEFENPLQQRAVEYFFYIVAPQISGPLNKHFWLQTVFFVAHDEPMIRYALATLSIEYERETGQVESIDRHSLVELENVSLHCYNRAIQLLLDRLSSPDSVSVPLMGCILFACIDFLRRNVLSAIRHVRGGLKLLQIWKSRCEDPAQREALFQAREYELIEDHMVQVMATLNLVTRTIGLPSMNVFSCKDLTAVPYQYTFRGDPFDDIYDANRQAMALLEKTLAFIMTAADTAGRSTVELRSEQQRILSLMDVWKAQIDISAEDPSFYAAGTSRRESGLLCAWMLCARLFVLALYAPDEMIWDIYREDFEELLRLIDPIVSDDVATSQQRTRGFVFDLGFVPVLQVVAWKCRYPTIRRRALRLLRAAARTELIFDSEYAAALYERLMTIEESSSGHDFHDDWLPPAPDRVHMIDVPPIPPTPQGHPINFLLKPNGTNGGWHVRCEYLGFLRVDVLDLAESQDWRRERASVNRLQGFAPVAG